MQYTQEEWNEIALTVARNEEAGATAQATMADWAGFALLMVLFLASTLYVVFGGAFALEASPLPGAQIPAAVVAPDSAHASRAARIGIASIHPAQPADYFPAAYPNRGRDGEGNVVTYEHD